MRAMLFVKPHTPLTMSDLPIPIPKGGEVLIQIEACGVCRTDLHLLDGEILPSSFPMILGHQIVGRIVKRGPDAILYPLETRVGVSWLAKTCGCCTYCLENQENLCEKAKFTGRDCSGGFAEYCVANEPFIFPIPSRFSSVEAAPLLCGGLIGFRSLQFLKESKKIGFYGFGSSAHILLQLCNHLKKEVYVFTREGDESGEERARALGAIWAGSSKTRPPDLLDGAVIFAPAGELIPLALKAIRKGGSVVCAGIHMSEIPAFSYDLLYGEKILRSVTNLTREDGVNFFKTIESIPLKVMTTLYPLEKVNEALDDLRNGKIEGSAVIQI